MPCHVLSDDVRPRAEPTDTSRVHSKQKNSARRPRRLVPWLMAIRAERDLFFQSL